ncbi:putative general secretion pathway protein A [Desulforapulum autotrophicum HRM2]|uniref:General secretion pathway protein A n=1 Tax=Desulforapulum autotrophicum (strain ATCC 43914 / DSM 3382 / VKM B-1955 / HRM2) TaxID=177437 RepID=C0QJ04_DESAH|nr:ExeA family protein [Desulforapulum autotrophicum]ACN13794.1 putative general secretion pathway protein A [Desulforapulum autotrophicum HRM2]
MYNTYFGFKEKPFKLVPNPEFLFLGKSHEEALAHLTYATTQGDGFVEITGEAGTGKTTLCRVFLENLDPGVDAAFIFNTNLDALGLLRAVNKELAIDATADTPTELVETLNHFLVENSRRGRSVILLIDEAQNLSIETLEQLRMLSNLETTKNKLIQIILVGQPELETLLGSHALRQLGQRINLSCRLLPMSLNETRAYINHRVNVASRREANLFAPGAQRSIYRYSGGIPRLINIACDRALVVAYSQNRPRIARSTARLAIHELSSRGQGRRPALATAGRFLLPGLIALVIGLLVFHRQISFLPFSSPPLSVQNAQQSTGTDVPVNLPLSTPSPTMDTLLPIVPGIKKKVTQGPIRYQKTVRHYLAENSPTATRETTLGRVISIWKQQITPTITPMVSQIQADHDFFKIGAMEQGLAVIRLKQDVSIIKALNLPVILPFILPDQNTKGYLLVSAIADQNEWIITAGEALDACRILPETLAPFLTGMAYIPFRESPGLSGIISKRSPGSQIINLKLLLKAIGFQGINLTADYDDRVKQAIIEIQSENGITVDGLAGPMTRILLYNRVSSFSTPHLRSPGKP